MDLNKIGTKIKFKKNQIWENNNNIDYLSWKKFEQYVILLKATKKGTCREPWFAIYWKDTLEGERERKKEYSYNARKC